MENRKSKIGAGLFGIFLGIFGAHNFYLGYTKRGILQCVLGAGSILLGFVCYILGVLLSVIYIGLLFVPLGWICNAVTFGIFVWALIEAILILAGKITVDGHGNPIGD